MVDIPCVHQIFMFSYIFQLPCNAKLYGSYENSIQAVSLKSNMSSLILFLCYDNLVSHLFEMTLYKMDEGCQTGKGFNQ